MKSFNFIPCMINSEDFLLVVDQCVSFKGDNGNTYFGRIVEFNPEHKLAFVAVNYNGDAKLADIPFIKGDNLAMHPLLTSCGIFLSIDRLTPLESGKVLLKEWADNPFRILYVEKYLAPLDAGDAEEGHGIIRIIPHKLRAVYRMAEESREVFKDWVLHMCDAPFDENESALDIEDFIEAYKNTPVADTAVNVELSEKLITFMNACDAVYKDITDIDDVEAVATSMRKMITYSATKIKQDILLGKASDSIKSIFEIAKEGEK